MIPSLLLSRPQEGQGRASLVEPFAFFSFVRYWVLHLGHIRDSTTDAMYSSPLLAGGLIVLSVVDLVGYDPTTSCVWSRRSAD